MHTMWTYFAIFKNATDVIGFTMQLSSNATLKQITQISTSSSIHNH